MKDMGDAAYVLIIKISRERNSKILYLDQEKYLDKVLNRFRMKNCKSLNTLVCKGTLSKSMCSKMRRKQVRCLKFHVLRLWVDLYIQ